MMEEDIPIEEVEEDQAYEVQVEVEESQSNIETYKNRKSVAFEESIKDDYK
jgi:hypothetical protein